MKILAIDPGNTQSAYVVLNDELRPIEFAKIDNEELFPILKQLDGITHFAIEMIASYGMSVGKTVFDTCLWIGRFYQTLLDLGIPEYRLIYRMEEKNNLCHSARAKDSNIRQALIDRFGVVGTKNAPGWFYGVSKDVWAAIAVGVTYYDLYINPQSQVQRRERAL